MKRADLTIGMQVGYEYGSRVFAAKVVSVTDKILIEVTDEDWPYYPELTLISGRFIMPWAEAEKAIERIKAVQAAFRAKEDRRSSIERRLIALGFVIEPSLRNMFDGRITIEPDVLEAMLDRLEATNA
jgi:hypothetical protein